MKFIALDVNVGDAFILEVYDNIFVVDGGMNQHGTISKIILVILM